MVTATYHVGFGVSSDEKTIKFYQKYLNFGKVRVTIEDDSVGNFGAFVGAGERYRWSMMTHNIRKVDFEPIQLLSRRPRPLPANYQWGDIGFNEVCFQVEGLRELYARLRDEGVKILCPPQKMTADGGKWAKEFFYFKDPDGINIKVEEDHKNFQKQAKVLGYHYLCLGVTHINDSLRFYRDELGYNRIIWDIEGHLEWMDPICGEKTYGRSVMLGSDFDEYLLQLVQISGRKPLYLLKDTRWGDVGLTEICLRVSDLEKICADLRRKNIKVLVEPGLASPQLDYAFIAYVADPDGNCIEFSFHKNK